MLDVGMRNAGLLASVAFGLAACTFVTSLNGLTGGGDADAGAPQDAVARDAVQPPDAKGDAAEAADAADANTGCDDDGLVAYWRFDEANGVSVHDCTKNQNDGVLTAGAWVAGVRGTAISIDGGGWVGFGSPTSLQLAGDLTATAFVRIRALSGTAGISSYIVGKSNGAGADGWRFSVTSSGSISFAITPPSGTYSSADTVSPVSELVWIHVAAVHQGSTMIDYVNGVDVSEVTDAAATIKSTAAEMRVGARGDGTNTLIGDVDEVRVYSRALSASEIAALAKQ
jgi:hypothetical protein